MKSINYDIVNNPKKFYWFSLQSMCLVLACSARLDAATFEDALVLSHQQKSGKIVSITNLY